LGNRNSEPLIIDDYSRTGTKAMGITGKLSLYGKYPSTVRTRLGRIAN